MVLALVCLAAYSLTIGGIPGRITLIEGNAKDVELGWPFDLRHTSSGLELLPFSGGVKLVPLAQGETSLEVRLWDLIPIKRMVVNVVPEVRVYPGGQSIGVLLPSRGVVVIGHYPVIGSDVTLPNGTRVNFTLVNGKADVTFTLPSTVGDYTLNATYNGNYRYNTSKNTGNVHVQDTPIIKTDVIVTPSNVSSHPAYNVTINVNVTDKNGNPVTSGTVSTIINGVTYTSNVLNGKATFKNVTMPNAGEYNYTVNYEGDSYYNPSTGTGILNITKFNTNLSVSNVTGEPGDNVLVFINLTDENGENLNGNVTVNLPNGSKIIVPIVNGKGNYTYTLPGVGNYTLNVTYGGDSLYNGSNGTGNVKVTSPIDPKLDVKVTPSNISSHPGYTVNITVNVTDSNGNPVQNGTASTTINGVTYTASVLNGKAIFKDVLMPNAGVYNYTVNLYLDIARGLQRDLLPLFYFTVNE